MISNNKIKIKNKNNVFSCLHNAFNGSVPLKIMNNTKIPDLSSLKDYMFICLPYNPSTINLHFLSNIKGTKKTYVHRHMQQHKLKHTDIPLKQNMPSHDYILIIFLYYIT